MKSISSMAFLSVAVFVLSSCTSVGSDEISVLSLYKRVDEFLVGNDICDTFSMTKEQIEIYLSKADKVDNYEFNQKAIIFPCKYEGVAEVYGDTLQWEISAGGAGYLYNAAGFNKRLLCKQECCTELPDLCL